MRCTIDDLYRVDRVLKHDSIYPFISDDNSLSVDEFTTEGILKNDNVYVLSPDEYTVFIAFPFNSVTYDIHVNMVAPEGRGKNAEVTTRMMLEYMFTETPCQKLISVIPFSCENVLLFALKMGMKLEGIIKKSYLKNGELQDQRLLGMTKEYWIKEVK